MATAFPAYKNKSALSQRYPNATFATLPAKYSREISYTLPGIACAFA